MRQYAYKIRIYPSEEQRVLIGKTFGCARLVYNLMLNEAIKSYNKDKKFKYPTPAKFKEEYKFLAEVDSVALCGAQLNLSNAFSRFIADRKDSSKKRKAGFPKHKKKKTAKKAYTTYNSGNKIRIENSTLLLPKLGPVKAVFHRRIEGRIKRVTVSLAGSGAYFASILVELPDLPRTAPDLNKVVGLDFSFSSLIVTNEGTKTKYIRWFQLEEQKLAKAQRRLAKKVYGSHGYEKQRVKVARIYERITARRLDYLLKLAKTLLDAYDVIVVEDIDLVSMAKKGKHRHFGKTIMDLGFGLFRKILCQKAEQIGKLFVKAPRFFASTQTCSACGYKNTGVKGLENLNIRSWVCPQCATHHDRDTNAAQNLVNWFYSAWSTGALPGINAEGDVSSTFGTNKGKKRRRFQKSCKAVDLASQHSDVPVTDLPERPIFGALA